MHLRPINPLISSKIKFKSGYKGLVCLNSTSYMSGLKDIWETSAVATKNNIYDWKPQSPNDGMIEIVAFRN